MRSVVSLVTVGECTVLIVDDEAAVRSAYRAFLARAEGYRLVGEAATGVEAIDLFEELHPDLVLMDLHMPRLDGVDAIRTITARWPRARVLALTTFATHSHVVAALRAGASGYLTKDASRADLLAGMEQALRGDMPLSPGVRRELVAELTAGGLPHAQPTPDGGAAVLTERERELLSWLALGLTNAQIASRMHLSEGTVKQYLVRVGGKLDAVSRTQILIRSIQLGVVDPHALPRPDADA